MAVVLHLSDTHLTREPGRLVMERDPDERLAAVLSAWNATGEQADLVVHTGDVTDDDSPEATARAARQIAALGAPVLAMCGNHDLPAAIRESFGPMTSAEVGAWRVISLETRVPGEIHGRVDVAAATELLDGVDSRPTVVAMHHPPRCRSTNPMFRLEGGDALLLELAARPHVRALLSGHLHDAYMPDGPGGLRLLNGPAVIAAIAHDGDGMEINAPGAPTGGRVLRLGDDGTLAQSLMIA